jgi:hypothetical protein
MKITALSGQSALDIAIQTTGSVESVIQLALANEISITDNTVPSDKLLQVDVINSDIVNYYKSRNIYPATWQGEWRILGGIGYMNIEGNFVIS